MKRPPAIEGTLESALYADDLDAAEVFYGQVLGLERIASVPGRHVFYRVGASVLLIFSPEATSRPPSPKSLPVPPHGAHGPGHYCFSVRADLLDEWRACLEDQAITIEADFCWPSGARSIYVRDPAGNSIEFAEPGLWS